MICSTVQGYIGIHLVRLIRNFPWSQGVQQRWPGQDDVFLYILLGSCGVALGFIYLASTGKLIVQISKVCSLLPILRRLSLALSLGFLLVWLCPYLSSLSSDDARFIDRC